MEVHEGEKNGWLTCSKPPSSSVVSIAELVFKMSNGCPVNWAARRTRLVLPLALGPTRIVIQLAWMDNMSDWSGRKFLCRTSMSSRLLIAPPCSSISSLPRGRTAHPTYFNISMNFNVEIVSKSQFVHIWGC